VADAQAHQSSELEDVVALIERHWAPPHPWRTEGGFACFEPMWDGRFGSVRVEVEGASLAAALRELAARFGQRPTVDFVWGALMGRSPDRLPLPLEPVMDDVKDRCDAGELLIALSRSVTPRVSRLAAFPEVYEVHLEFPDGRTALWPWSTWSAGVEALVSLR
jgi:hypothetical protein